MAYVLNLFTPATWAAFQSHGADITGFSKAHRARARNLVKPGDIFVCYMVRLSRWCGALEVIAGPFEDDTPIFEKQNDPWVVRFRVKEIVGLSAQSSIPIRSDHIWKHLSRTKELSLNSPSWPVRAGLQSSLVRISDEDGSYLVNCLTSQSANPRDFPLTEAQQKLLGSRTDVVSTPTGPVSVIVPPVEEFGGVESAEEVDPQVVRHSIQMQATLVSIGARLGFEVWIPKSDRTRVLGEVKEDERACVIGQLPLSFNDATLKTIENIDILWLRKRRIVRAFEVEHTTAIYSGLLRNGRSVGSATKH